MKMAAPPRHTPVSMRSPGTSSSSTRVTHAWRLSRRRSPIIVSASDGQSRPSARASRSKELWRMSFTVGSSSSACRRCHSAWAEESRAGS
jgi:hypothetical protein